MKPTDARTVARLERIRKLLQVMDMNVVQLADAVFITKHWLKPYADYLLSTEEVHIVDWVRPSGRGQYVRVLRYGPGENKPRPSQITNAEKQKRARKRMQDDPERYEKHLKVRRIKLRVRAMRATPQPWFAALPGAKSIPKRAEAA